MWPTKHVLLYPIMYLLLTRCIGTHQPITTSQMCATLWRQTIYTQKMYDVCMKLSFRSQAFCQLLYWVVCIYFVSRLITPYLFVIYFSLLKPTNFPNWAIFQYQQPMPFIHCATFVPSPFLSLMSIAAVYAVRCQWNLDRFYLDDLFCESLPSKM